MNEFSSTQLRYIDWLAASKFERSPTTELLLAKELGITDRTLRRWKLLPGFREAITQRARELLGEDLNEIYGALRREAVKGSFNHIKLALELTGEHTDTVEVTWRNKLPPDKDPEQVIKQFSELLNLAAKNANTNS